MFVQLGFLRPRSNHSPSEEPGAADLAGDVFEVCHPQSSTDSHPADADGAHESVNLDRSGMVLCSNTDADPDVDTMVTSVQDRREKELQVRVPPQTL